MPFQGFLKCSKDVKIAWWCVRIHSPWHSGGTELSGQYGDGHWHAARWCHQWVKVKSFSWFWYAAAEAHDNNS